MPSKSPTRARCRAGLLLAVIMLALAGAGPAAEEQKTEVNRWEPKIRQFELMDKRQMPPADGILFVGSSSIVGWKVEESFPGLPVINRGFGGSQIADSVHFADRIILPYRPRVIVLYAGDNDVAAGKSPRQVFDDYRQFVNTVRDALPQARIVFIAIKPSIRRWHLVDRMREANRLIRAAAEKDDRLAYVDVDAPMIGDDGKPRAELFKPDGLHLNSDGYKLWSALLLPHLKPGRSGSRPAIDAQGTGMRGSNRPGGSQSMVDSRILVSGRLALVGPCRLLAAQMRRAVGSCKHNVQGGSRHARPARIRRRSLKRDAWVSCFDPPCQMRTAPHY